MTDNDVAVTIVIKNIVLIIVTVAAFILTKSGWVFLLLLLYSSVEIKSKDSTAKKEDQKHG